jgi:DNA mismatch repair protein MutS2
MIQALLFNQKEKMQQASRQKKVNEKYIELIGEIKIGDKVKMRQNRQVGIVKEIKGKKAVLQVGVIPITVALEDLTLVKDKEG